VEAADGKMRWRFLAEKWFWTKAVAYDNTIYAGCFDGRVYALGAENGEKLAEFDLGSPIYSWPVLVGGSIIITSEEGKVYAIDVSTNQIKLLADVEEAVYAPPCASGGVVYIYSQTQNLYALNAASGAKLWSQTIK
jgi:serine/threonine-protein kinase